MDPDGEFELLADALQVATGCLTPAGARRPRGDKDRVIQKAAHHRQSLTLLGRHRMRVAHHTEQRHPNESSWN
ncbi:MAG: hypothetical protein HW416_1348 [Chloroflexi bacterium]|nr:hypothetical protein [Chloroflexota bacterium]